MDTELMSTHPEASATPVDPLDDPVLTTMGLLFEAAAGAHTLLGTTLVSDSGLTDQLFEPLLRLARSNGGRLRMTDLAAQCRYSASAVTRVSDRLEALGFATRESCPSDRRVVHLAITETGRRAVAEAMPPHVRMIDARIFANVDAGERRELDRLLRKVRDAVHPCAAAVTPETDAPAGR